MRGKESDWIACISRDISIYKTFDKSFWHEIKLSNRILKGEVDKKEIEDLHKQKIIYMIQRLIDKLNVVCVTVFTFDDINMELKPYMTMSNFIKTTKNFENYKIKITPEIKDKLCNDKYRFPIDAKSSDIYKLYNEQYNMEVPEGYTQTILIKCEEEVIGVLDILFSDSYKTTVLQQDYMELVAYEIGMYLKDKEIANNLIDALKQKVQLEKIIEFDKMQATFLTNVSHEFKTPINIILTAAKLINMENEKTSNSNIKKYSDYIVLNSYRLLKMVYNLLDVTSIDRGIYNVKMGNYNIVRVIEDITNEVIKYVGKKRNIIINKSKEIIISRCSSNCIERIMLNILSNAVKNTKDKGTIIVSIYEQTNNYVVVSVKNDGLPISKEHSKKIFDRFSKDGNVLNRLSEGNGLGLYLCKKLIDFQNGQIFVNTEVEDGAEFIFKVPLSRDSKIDGESKILTNKAEKCAIEFSDVYLE